ncbi:MAG: hypothetical protein WD157_00130 [Patescibacteria group bacterium]
MGWFGFGKKSAKIGFKNVDWLEVEGKLRQLDAMNASADQVMAKQLIIQVDVLIDSILKQGNCPGQTMGERLKSLQNIANRSTLNMLWGVHKKRNELAHESGSFMAGWEKDKYYQDAKMAISNLRGIR